MTREDPGFNQGNKRAWGAPILFLICFLLLYFVCLSWPVSRYPAAAKAGVVLGLIVGALLYLGAFVALVRFGRLSRAERLAEQGSRLVKTVEEQGGPFFLVLWSGFCNIAVFAYAFRTEEILHPGSFSQAVDTAGALYFSVVTVFTVGYGDIAPVTTVARMTVAAQICLGFLTLALLGNALTKERE